MDAIVPLYFGFRMLVTVFIVNREVLRKLAIRVCSIAQLRLRMGHFRTIGLCRNRLRIMNWRNRFNGTFIARMRPQLVEQPAASPTLPIKRGHPMLSRFQHILVPLDFTEKNRAALDIAFEMAVANQARVTLLHVIEPIDLPGDEEVQDFVEQLRQRADRELETCSQRFNDAEIACNWKIRYGKRAVEVSMYERDHNVDLIALSSHPIDADHPSRSLATLSYQIAVLSRCPVLLVK